MRYGSVKIQCDSLKCHGFFDVEAETLVPSLLVYRALLSETRARKLVVSDASLRTGLLLDAADPGGRSG